MSRTVDCDCLLWGSGYEGRQVRLHLDREDDNVTALTSREHPPGDRVLGEAGIIR